MTNNKQQVTVHTSTGKRIRLHYEYNYLTCTTKITGYKAVSKNGVNITSVKLAA